MQQTAAGGPGNRYSGDGIHSKLPSKERGGGGGGVESANLKTGVRDGAAKKEFSCGVIAIFSTGKALPPLSHLSGMCPPPLPPADSLELKKAGVLGCVFMPHQNSKIVGDENQNNYGYLTTLLFCSLQKTPKKFVC